MEARCQDQLKRDEIRKKQQQKRFKLMAEERRLRDLQRLAIEEAEEERRRRIAQVWTASLSIVFTRKNVDNRWLVVFNDKPMQRH
jgi:hypothetical protein